MNDTLTRAHTHPVPCSLAISPARCVSVHMASRVSLVASACGSKHRLLAAEERVAPGLRCSEEPFLNVNLGACLRRIECLHASRL